MKRLLALLFLFASRVLAGGFSFDPQFTPQQLSDLGEAMAELLAFPNLTTAAPSGVAGFEVMGVAGGLSVSSRERWYRYAVDEKTTLGLLPAYRVVARKGLPWNLDVGAQYGQFAGEPFWGGELRWSLFEGGVILPALGLSGSWTWFSHPQVDFRVGELKLVASKGFVLLAPYAGVGVRHQEIEAFFGDPAPRWHRAQGDRTVVLAGVVIHPLPLLRVVAEARRGAFTSYFVALGVGL
ncbi:hypothetical protein HRbin09_01041 [bacterium HR09]|nr:hypothetical protein HRbin09_01041 [bacterium HR09]